MSFVVKIQRSLATSEPVPQVLIYNEHQTVKVQMDLTPGLAKLMGERVKVYAIAHQDSKGLHIKNLTRDRDW